MRNEQYIKHYLIINGYNKFFNTKNFHFDFKFYSRKHEQQHLMLQRSNHPWNSHDLKKKVLIPYSSAHARVFSLKFEIMIIQKLISFIFT